MTDEPHPNWRISDTKRSRARALRRDMTPAERKLWYALRAHRFEGVGFRRQTPIGPYVADFVSHKHKLIIEVDGGQHFHGVPQRRDVTRDAFLTGEGYRMLRFANNQVERELEGVLMAIAEVLGLPPPYPSPASGRGDPTTGAEE